MKEGGQEGSLTGSQGGPHGAADVSSGARPERGLRFDREWKPRVEVPVADDRAFKEGLERLADATGLSRPTLQVCLSRGLDSAEAIGSFLQPRLETLTDPNKIRDMDRAVERLAAARDAGEHVRIFGDYDVDGTSGAALLSWTFREMGFRCDAVQPDRFKDGYGLNVGAIEQAAAEGIRLMVTVDCGITSFDAAERARELGVDLIVLDHHQLDPKRGIPPALAVVNPQRPDCESGLKQLCGCGVAFYLAMALRAYGRRNAWFSAELPEPNLKSHLDLVVIATAADMVPLTGDNRVLVRHGLEVLRRTRKPGVSALMDVCGIGKNGAITPSQLGFAIGPRINASGRLKSAGIALELLTTTDGLTALTLAQQLEKLNRERQDIQNAIWDKVRERVEEGITQGRFRHAVVVADEGWHEGVVGIVASRVTETFHRPAIVMSVREDGIAKGSVRSYAGKDVLAALRECADLMLGFGGHKFAAGLSLSPDRLPEFIQAFDMAIGRQAVEGEKLPPIYFECEVDLSELDLKTLGEIEQLGPFGPGNPEPVFKVRATTMSHRVIKERHLKLNLGSEGFSSAIEAIWFGAAEREEYLTDDVLNGVGEWAGVPELNRFRGRVTPNLRIRAWRKVQVTAAEPTSAVADLLPEGTSKSKLDL